MNVGRNIAIVGLASLALALGACASDEEQSEAAPSRAVETSEAAIGDAESNDASSEQKYPDVIKVVAEPDGEDTWTFKVTLSSPYDTPERYADAWRVVGPDGTVYGERILGHDHASEQPFTRSESGIKIPKEVKKVTVEARDKANGWGGQTMEYELPA